MKRNITDIFVDYLYSLGQSSISNSAYEQANLCLLDFRGVASAGARILDKQGNAFLSIVKKQSGEVSVVGRLEKTSLQNAAFLNAMDAHITELDDGHRKGQIHLGASIISALLPVAEVERLERTDVLRGIIIGYEAAIRLAMAMNPAHKLRGYHTSGTCGAIGTAVAIASALNVSREVLKNVISAAVSSAAGLLELQEDQSELKPYNLAQAAVGGITAAYCALAGFKGPEDAIGGKRGLLAVMTEQPQTQFLTEFDEPFYQIETIYRKPYAACRHAHSALEAALKLRLEYDIPLKDIIGIRIDTYEMAIRGHDHKIIKGIQSAKLSIPFSVALALVKGSVGLNDYTEENLNDSTILSLINKIDMVVDPVINTWLPERRAARVVINLGYEEYSELIEYPKGEPENAMNETDLINRFSY